MGYLFAQFDDDVGVAAANIPDREVHTSYDTDSNKAEEMIEGRRTRRSHPSISYCSLSLSLFRSSFFIYISTYHFALSSCFAGAHVFP